MTSLSPLVTGNDVSQFVFSFFSDLRIAQNMMSDRLDWQTMRANMGTQVILARLPPGQRTSRDHLRIAIELSSTQEDVQPVAMKPLIGCKGLWVYRFEIPSGEFFRFRLSWSSAPSGRSSAARRLVDFAFRRAVVERRGICAKHLRRRREDDNDDSAELHLGEADYLALLSHGACACKDDDDDDDKTGRQVERRDGAGEEGAIVRVRNNRTTENEAGIESGQLYPRTDTEQKQSDDTDTEEPATGFPSPVKQALQVLLTQRKVPTVRVSKPTGGAGGHFVPGRARRVETWKDSEVSVSQDETPAAFVKLQDPRSEELATGLAAVNCASNKAFVCNETQEMNAAAAAAAAGEDVDLGQSLTGIDAMTDGMDDDVLEVYSSEKCRREPVRANRRDNVLFTVVEDERVFILSSASERLKSALTFPSQPLSTDLVADLLELVFSCESFLRNAASVETGDPSGLGPEDPAVIGYVNTLTSEDSGGERPDPDEPDSLPDQLTIENEFRPANLFRDISVRSKDGSRWRGVTPVDFAFGFEEITLRSESPSPPPSTEHDTTAEPPRPSRTAADDDDPAWSDRRRCSSPAAAAAAAGTLWERWRRAIGRFLSAVGRFFRNRFPRGLRRRRRQKKRLNSSDLKMLRSSRPMAEEDGRV